MEKETILLQLCAKAPTIEIRNCIRLYDPKKSLAYLKKLFNKPQVGVLIATLQYLKTPNLRPCLDDYVKPGLINHVICRIKNLFPCKCTTCNETFCTSIDSKPLLPCENCGQEPHAPCIAAKLKLGESTEINELDSISIKELLNPHDIPGWSYLCAGCRTSYIQTPDDYVKKTVLLRETKSSNETPHTDDQHRNDDQPDENHSEDGTPIPTSPDTTDSLEQNQNNSVPKIDLTATNGEKKKTYPPSHPSAFKNLCQDYLKFKCIYGRNGKGCPKEHPFVCRNLLDHGTKGPHGCDGKQCHDLHPKICNSSLSHLVCNDRECELFHIKGTKRQLHTNVKNTSHSNERNVPNPSSKKESSSQNATTSSKDETNPQASKSENSQSFLEAVRLLKSELLETMDTRFATLLSELPERSSTRTATGVENCTENQPKESQLMNTTKTPCLEFPQQATHHQYSQQFQPLQTQAYHQFPQWNHHYQQTFPQTVQQLVPQHHQQMQMQIPQQFQIPQQLHQQMQPQQMLNQTPYQILPVQTHQVQPVLQVQQKM